MIGAGCVLKGNYPSNSVVVQKRDTEIRGGGYDVIIILFPRMINTLYSKMNLEVVAV